MLSFSSFYVFDGEISIFWFEGIVIRVIGLLFVAGNLSLNPFDVLFS